VRIPERSPRGPRVLKILIVRGIFLADDSPMAPPSPPELPAWVRRLTGYWAAAAVLAAFWGLMLASLSRKSLTFDEMGHATAGYTYWRFNDYRLDPENGNLPQRVAALPLLGGGFAFPSLDSDAWRQSDFWPLGYPWFNKMGNDASAMLARGRAACGLMAVAVGFLVWRCSRRLHGPAGGMLSLILLVLSPTLLANGALMTSDTACALFFLASCLACWAMLQRLTPATIALSGLAMGGLFVTKASAVLIVPMALVMLAARLFDGRPLPVAFGRARELAGRGRQAAAFAGAILAHVVIVMAVIWGFYGFRYAAFSDSQPGRDAAGDQHMYSTWEERVGKPLLPALLKPLRLSPDQTRAVVQLLRERAIVTNVWTWDALRAIPVIEETILTPGQARELERERAEPPHGLVPRVMDWARNERLLPESYLFGMARVLNAAQIRQAFLNGEYSVHGWVRFFPYTVLVKTPLPVFGVILLAIAAALRRPLRRTLYDTIPLWTLLAVYWAVFLHSSLNIGHRHILATYPPLFILCGGAADWLLSRRRIVAAALVALMVLLTAEVLCRFPNYLAYFNTIAGGPANGYRHLVDSSLDWGQDLPGVAGYVGEHHLTGPTYLSYFGAADPAYYHVPSRLLYSFGFTISDPMPTPVFVAPVPPGGLDETRGKVLRENPGLELAGTGTGGDGEVAVFLVKPAALRLSGGTYFISATQLQTLQFDMGGPWGPWNDRFEATYQRVLAAIRPLLADDPAARWAAFTRRPINEWLDLFYDYEQYRFARLAAYLRRREPDDEIGYSILVYRLTDDDISRALDGPQPEHGKDVLRLLDASTRLGPAN